MIGKHHKEGLQAVGESAEMIDFLGGGSMDGGNGPRHSECC